MVVFLLCLAFPKEQLLAQNLDYPIIVLDAVDETPVEFVNIIYVGKDGTQRQLGLTDEAGKAKISGFQNDTIYFEALGYQNLKLTFNQIKGRYGKVFLQETFHGLPPVTVSAGSKYKERRQDIPSQVEVLDDKHIAFVNPQTSATLLESSGNVFVQRTQMGGGSPVIRGFEANKVLLVLDGVRLNNAIYRNGHLQNVITIDANMLERTEVVFGPASVIYGSDALGGVMHFYTKEPKLLFEENKRSREELNAMVRYATANAEKSAHFDYSYGKRKWASVTSFTATDYNHLRAGNNRPNAYPEFGKRLYFVDRIDQTDTILMNNRENVQFFTGYSQYDFLQKFRFQPNDSLKFTLNFQTSTSSNVPRYDKLTETSGTYFLDDTTGIPGLKWAQWDYGPQRRMLLSARAEISDAPSNFFDYVSLLGAIQSIGEGRISRRFGDIYERIQQENVNVYSLNVDFIKNVKGENKDKDRRILYGAEWIRNNVSSQAGRINIENNQIDNKERTRYPLSGSTMTNFAFYFNYRWKPQKNVTFIGGARYTITSTFLNFGGTDGIDELPFANISNNDGDFTGSLGMAWVTKSKWNINGLISTGFRAPNVDDLGKIRAKFPYVTVPNPSLKSERAFNMEMTLSKLFNEKVAEGAEPRNRIQLSTTAFYTFLYDAMVRQSFQLNGRDSIPIDGEMHATQANVNIGSARVFGWNGNVRFDLNRNWQFKSSLNITKGVNTVDDDPLGHIPPMYGQTTFAYLKDKYKIELAVRYNGAKWADEYPDPLIDNVDNLDATPINEDGEHVGSLPWATFSIYSAYQINEKFTINVAMENLFDKHYRAFGSTVSAPGFNFMFALRGHF